MIESFFEGFLLGLGAAVPLGPINILIMNQALKNYKFGIATGFGAMSADMIYLIMIFIGLISFMNNPIFLNILGILGSLFLLYLGIKIYQNRNKQLELHQSKITTHNIFKIYIQGFILTLLNPYTIAFWLSIAGYVVNKELDMFFTIAGMLSAITLWITMMPYFINKTKHKISQKISVFINIFSFVILCGFAISLFVHVLFY